MSRALAVVLVAVLAAGCLAPAPETVPAADVLEAPADAAPGVVVADVARGVNPYHDAFRRPDWTHHPSTRIAGFPADAPPLVLTLGDDYEASVAADEAVWASAQPGVVYWVPGTNLLLLAHRTADWMQHANLANPTDHHSTQTAHAIAAQCPDCYVLAVQDASSIDGEPVRVLAEEHPWVDLVTSTAYPGSSDEYVGAYASRSYAEATRALAARGGLFMGPTGNTPVAGITPVPYHHIGLPPWVVSVGGAHAACSATEPLAGKPAELVGNFTQTLARSDSAVEVMETSGTSFATPHVAGAFGRALLEVRRVAGPPAAPGALAGDVTAEDLRRAMHAAARWFAPEDYTPGCGFPVWDASGPRSGTPSSATPWVEMGWGFVGEPEALLAARIALGEEEAPPKPPQAAAFMAAWHAARSAAYP